MKKLITLILAYTLYSQAAMAQQHAVGAHIGGMPFYSIGMGLNYLYLNKMHQIGAAISVGDYGNLVNGNLDENNEPNSATFVNARVFYNRILGKDPIGLYLGGGAQWLHIPQKPHSDINALLAETHVGISFTIGKRLRANIEQAFAVGPSWGAQEGRTEFGKEIRNTVQTGSYFPFTVNVYYLFR